MQPPPTPLVLAPNCEPIWLTLNNLIIILGENAICSNCITAVHHRFKYGAFCKLRILPVPLNFWQVITFVIGYNEVVIVLLILFIISVIKYGTLCNIFHVLILHCPLTA